jgi:hypothetical protein
MGEQRVPVTIFTVAALAFSAGTVVSFFTFPLWIIFAINIAKDGTRSDWLGFFGSVMAGGVTLIAAVVAWFAVKIQIDTQKIIAERQASLAEFETLRRVSLIIGKEIRFIRRIRTVINRATTPEEIYFKGDIYATGVTTAKGILENVERDAAILTEKYLKSDAEMAPFANPGKRSAVYQKMLDVRYDGVRKAITAVSEVERRSTESGSLSDADKSICQEIKLHPVVQRANEAVTDYLRLIEQERDRVIPQMKSAQKRASL